eukprot:COSAG06_NODE_15052_length_1101_cov_1.075848_1_plen_91_part_10
MWPHALLRAAGKLRGHDGRPSGSLAPARCSWVRWKSGSESGTRRDDHLCKRGAVGTTSIFGLVRALLGLLSNCHGGALEVAAGGVAATIAE